MTTSSVNKMILIGNLGAEPDMSIMPNNSAVTTFRIATTETWKDKKSGELQERTEWHNIKLFARLAELADRYLHKGSKVYLEGRSQTQAWIDNNGVARYKQEFVIKEMQFLDPPPSATNKVAPTNKNIDFDDDDLPF